MLCLISLPALAVVVIAIIHCATYTRTIGQDGAAIYHRKEPL